MVTIEITYENAYSLEQREIDLMVETTLTRRLRLELRKKKTWAQKVSKGYMNLTECVT